MVEALARHRRLVAVLLVFGAVLFVLGAALQWSDVGPIGSDNDEYREVARAMLDGNGPVTGGGVEGTKYPLGYPLLLALVDLVGLPVTGTAQVLSLMAVAVLAIAMGAMAWRTATEDEDENEGGSGSAVPAVTAVAALLAFLLTNPTIWGLVRVTMPDAIALALTALIFLVMWSAPSALRTRALLALLTVSVALKSLSVILAPAVMLALLLDTRPGARRWRPWAAGAVVLPLLVVVVGALAVAGHPEHTTGYAATFFLENPFDQAAGELGIGGVVARLWERVDVVATIGGKSALGPQHASWWTWPTTLVLVVLGVVGSPRLRWPLTAYVVAYVGVLALWPYQSVRLSSPILPVAALGVFAAFRFLTSAALGARRALGGVALAVVVALAGALVVDNLAQVRQTALDESARDAEIERDLLGAVAYLQQNADPSDQFVSFDYRELAHRLGRPVLPLGYTSDVADLRAASVGAGADWFVLVDGFSDARVHYGRALLASAPEAFVLVFEQGRVEIWAIDY